ncbi:metal-dependent transcriptional regulator [Streptococcus moroccensis]|uniref:Manganese transport regulator n=1 Tax=Streptococcus moroccensis TaxID=1451356 RepID=A0ABT9YWL8_9STRE|nr:metal-dependent transcriptional regulator [Streptococcus moroccensis]MDQ0223460.1 DtxR family Mn-dependent transcriptional regulator [Streptococcus moroccensis]
MTPNKEDYLKCLYELSLQEPKISNKQVAEVMKVSAPAVTEMLKKLIADDLIIKDKQSGYALTASGQYLVAALYRKHRLIEVFLVNHLGYTIEQVHEEAEVLEHTVSTLFIERLEKLLDYPKTCPHGGTIPAQGQLLIEKYQQTLDQLDQRGSYRLVRVQDDYQLLDYLEQHDIKVGDQIDLTQIDDYAGTFSLKTKSASSLQVTVPIAQKLYVEKLS